MFSKILTMKSTEKYWHKIDSLKNEIRDADAVLVGAGAGLSTAAGLAYSGERFKEYFSDFADKYGIRDMYSGGFILLAVWRNTGRGGRSRLKYAGDHKIPVLADDGKESGAVYVCVNKGEAVCPQEIKKRSVCIDGDIGKVLELL